MLGKRDPQRDLFAAPTQLGAKAVEKMGFYAQVSKFGHQIFTDEDFADLYCPNNGRPSTPPSLLSLARVLQHYDGISDAEVVARARYDLRWKVALDLDPLSTEAPFVKSTFQAFRVRLTLHLKDGLAFEKSVKAARDAGLLPKRLRVALDSSPVRGRGALKDTFNLLSDAIAAVVRSVAKKKERTAEDIAQEAGLERHIEAPSVKGSEEIDWSDEAEKSKFLEGILEDCHRAFDLSRESGCASEEVELLKKVIAQNVEQPEPPKSQEMECVPEGPKPQDAQQSETDVEQPEEQKPRIRQGVARDRTVSISDPDMRHGRKSSGKTYNGHKAHIAVDMESRIITAVDMSTPQEADGARVQALLKQTEQTTGSEIEQAVGDCAYSSSLALEQAQELNVELKTKMPSTRRGGLFGASDFQVSKDGKTARCPKGHTSARHYKSTSKGHVHYWSEEQCESCPLKSACTSAKRRMLSVPGNFHDRRERERYARSPEGRQLLRQRAVVEHGIGRLKNLGAGTARYFGRTKSKAQWMWTAAVANLYLVWGQATTS